MVMTRGFWCEKPAPDDGSGFTTISYLLHTTPSIHQTRLQCLMFRGGGRFSTGTVDGSRRERTARAARVSIRMHHVIFQVVYDRFCGIVRMTRLHLPRRAH